MKLLPVSQSCFICQKNFKAEWGKQKSDKKWHTDFLCFDCQASVK